MAAELYGLVLAGGRSKRMQRDKAQLAYDGTPQLARAMSLLGRFVSRAFVSIRADQRGDPLRSRYAVIEDLLPDLGPIGGIHAALHAHPDHAWLVLACDLPLLDAATLEHLIAHRRTERIATAYRSRHDGLPEPLCAIYEPAARAIIDERIGEQQFCPRALLRAVDGELLDPIYAEALDNVNTAAEYQALVTAGGASAQAPTRAVHVRYFALLREQAGRDSESVDTRATTARELYAELSRRHGFTAPESTLRVALNNRFADWTQRLAASDVIAFLPPVAGG